MCGIAGIYVKDPKSRDLPPTRDMERFINCLLLGIESRGKDSTGILSVRTGSRKAKLEKQAVPASWFTQQRGPLIGSYRTVLLHTRATTQGSEKNSLNNHPVKYGNVFVTHNGHIRNDDDLFKEHGFTRHGQVDTEIIPALLNKYGLETPREALDQIIGNMAIAAVDPRRSPDTLLLAKGQQSPLHYYETELGITWASTEQAIIDAWKAIWGVEIPRTKIKSLPFERYLLVTPTETVMQEFKVKYSNSLPGGRSGHHGQGYGWHRHQGSEDEYERYPDRNGQGGPSNVVHINRGGEPFECRRRVCANCGCTQWWHDSESRKEKMRGGCTKGGCKCTEYKWNGQTLPVDKESPSESHARFPDSDLARASAVPPASVRTTAAGDSDATVIPGKRVECTVNGDTYFMNECMGCSKMLREDEMEDYGGWFVCKKCDGERVEDGEFDVPAHLVNLADLDEDDLYEQAVIMAAQELELTPAYIDHLVNEIEEKDFVDNDALLDEYCLAADAVEKYRHFLSPTDKTQRQLQLAELGVEPFADSARVEDIADSTRRSLEEVRKS